MRYSLLSSSGKEAPLLGVEIRAVLQVERIKAALRATAIYFAMAIACIFIPVFHFVLVPLFLIISIVSFFRTMRVKLKIGPGVIHCLECNHPHKIETCVRELPMRYSCSSCRAQISVHAN